MEINLITGNMGKVAEFKSILGPIVTINHMKLDYPELRSDDVCEIAKLAAKQLADKLGKNIVVEDSGFFITELNGFPGACSAYIHERIGLLGLLKLMDGISNRECFYRSAVGYCEPGSEPVAFLGEEKGEIADSIRGDKGFGHDPIFIPEGSTATYGEIGVEAKKFRRKAIEGLLEFLR